MTQIIQSQPNVVRVGIRPVYKAFKISQARLSGTLYLGRFELKWLHGVMHGSSHQLPLQFEA